MKIAVLGAGVVGVTSAWFLNRKGHEVVVLDREPGPALETSYANGGQISWGYATPWASPGIITKVLRWQFDPDSPLRLHWPGDRKMWAFLFKMLANAAPATYERNKARLLRLGRYSYQTLAAIREETGIEYERGPGGLLQLIRDPADMSSVSKELKIFAANDIPAKAVDRDECIAIEPGLASRAEAIAGGIYFPQDESGNCRTFTQKLADDSARRGVEFRFGVTVKQLRHDKDRITGLETDAGLMEADAYVLAAGSYTPSLLAPLGIELPVYPVKGYSLTAPITDHSRAPRSTLMDEGRKVAITRLGNKLRAAGIAELAGFDLSLPARHYGVVERAVRDLFPEAADYTQIEWWCGLRPMTPDGPPVIGATPFANLYLNSGHGTLGWTLSCGSARALADIVSGSSPEIDMEGLTLDRYA